jgi:hypothetical protein
VVVLRKLVPFTVRVSGPDPAAAVVGLIELTVGVVSVTGVVPPEPDVDPEVAEDPPQPASKVDARRQKEATVPSKFFMRHIIIQTGQKQAKNLKDEPLESPKSRLSGPQSFNPSETLYPKKRNLAISYRRSKSANDEPPTKQFRICKICHQSRINTMKSPWRLEFRVLPPGRGTWRLPKPAAFIRASGSDWPCA